MMPLPDWDNPVFTLDDEDFRALEQPKPRYIYDALSEPDSDLINSDTFPMLVGWEPGQVRGMQ
jgi:hypothetical protein